MTEQKQELHIGQRWLNNVTSERVQVAYKAKHPKTLIPYVGYRAEHPDSDCQMWTLPIAAFVNQFTCLGFGKNDD